MAFQKILVPVDFTETSKRAVEYSVALAAKLGAAVIVLHAVEMPVVLLPDGGFVPTAAQAAAMSEAAQRHLDAIIAPHLQSGVEITGILRTGNGRDVILEAADEISADLIVMGTHGRGPIARALLGSVGPHVIRAAKQPVLTIPGPHE
jgi:nucleotide-binding universal stress UspA family protein